MRQMFVSIAVGHSYAMTVTVRVTVQALGWRRRQTRHFRIWDFAVFNLCRSSARLRRTQIQLLQVSTAHG